MRSLMQLFDVEPYDMHTLPIKSCHLSYANKHLSSVQLWLLLNRELNNPDVYA